MDNRASIHILLRASLIIALLLIGGGRSLHATIRVSNDDGAWESIYWSPEGVPQAGDTIIIATSVSSVPSGEFGMLIIRPKGRLHIERGTPQVQSVLNEGRIDCERSSVLRVMGEVTNRGIIAGDGAVQMMKGGSIISGVGVFGNLIVGSAPGAAIYLADDLTVRSLALAAGSRLIAGDNNLTVNGPYSSASSFGAPGIEGTTGVIRLNGSVYGTARGNVVLGSDPSIYRSKRARAPEVHALLGDHEGSVRFASSRRIGFSTLLGAVTIDSGAVLEGSGIGASGGNRVIGSMTVEGALTGGDGGYAWEIEGELFNRGKIESCVLKMSGHRAVLRSDSGEWDPSIGLIFTGRSGSELAIEGSIAVAHLTIVPRTSLDSNISVIAGGSVVRIRHRFTSDIAHRCRLRSDTTVSIWGASNGIVEGPVTFEGFWGSPIAGVYGAAGRTVRFAARKSISGPIEIVGSLICDARAPMAITSSLVMRRGGVFKGDITLPSGATIISEGDLRVERPVRGGGTISIIGSAPSIDILPELGDSVRIEIGGDSIVTKGVLARRLHLPYLTIHPRSYLRIHGGDSIEVTGEMRYGVRYLAGYNTTSTPVDPLDPRASAVFSNALNVLRYDDGYIAEDTIEVGAGYYVRFARDTTIWHRGRSADPPRTIPLKAGWNLIGGLSVAIPTGNITIEGTTLLSGFVTSLGGAQSVDIIEPGRGYWVNAEGEGSVVLEGGP